LNVGNWKRKQKKLKIGTPVLPELHMKNCVKEKKKENRNLNTKLYNVVYASRRER